jgi:superfamily II DNA or RNA helicase
MATGLGKTAVALSYAETTAKKILWVVHTDELISQAVMSAAKWAPTKTVGVVAAERNQIGTDLVIASVQTVSKPGRLQQLDNKFDLVIIDEAHRSRAVSYETVIRELKAGQPDGPLLLGLTATPYRTDGKGLAEIYPVTAFARDVAWAIMNGHLCDLKAKSVVLNFDLGSVKNKGADYDTTDLDRAMREVDSLEVIIEKWLQYAPGRKTVVMCPTVAFARDLADLYTAAGIPAGAVYGAQPKDQRQATIMAHKTGQIQVMTSVMVLVEGYDDPSIDCVVMACPTKSRLKYTQAVGRGLRLHSGKDDCLLLDMVGVSQVHSLITAADVLGLELLLEGESAKTKLEIEQQQQLLRDIAEQQILETDLLEGDVIMRDVDALGRPKGTAARYGWVLTPIASCARRFTNATSPKGEVVIRPYSRKTLGAARDKVSEAVWCAALCVAGAKAPHIIGSGDLKGTLRQAERWLDRNGGRVPSADGTLNGPSIGQARFLEQRGVNYAGWSRGKCGAIIQRYKLEEDRTIERLRWMTVEDIAAKGVDKIVAGVPAWLQSDARLVLSKIHDVAQLRGHVA